MNSKLSWPTEYKKIFIEGGEYYEFAHFGWANFDVQLAGYIKGYKEAADLLIDHAVESQDISTLGSVQK